MKTSLYKIQSKISNLQHGLLRFYDEDELLTLLVRTTANKDASLNCIVADDFSCSAMTNKIVNLIQKNHDNYLYITGKVLQETQKGRKTLSVRIVKASWFIRKQKGTISWLKEKYVYPDLQEE